MEIDTAGLLFIVVVENRVPQTSNVFEVLEVPTKQIKLFSI